MFNKEEAIKIAKKYVLKEYRQEYPVIFAYLIKNHSKSFYNFDHWSISFQLPIEWDPNELIIIVNAKSGKAEGFPTL